MGLNDEREKIDYARTVIGDLSRPLDSVAVQAALEHLSPDAELAAAARKLIADLDRPHTMENPRNTGFALDCLSDFLAEVDA